MKMIRRFALLVILSLHSTNEVTAFLPQSSVHRFVERTRLYSKNSHRARVEKNFEDMMGNDWRMFRAQLVAQEKAEKKNKSNKVSATSSSLYRSAHSHKGKAKVIRKTNDIQDEKLARQEKFGNIFASIFNNNQKGVRAEDDSQNSIFDGQHVGGATPDSMIPFAFEDPFVSEAELPVLLQSKVRVDKHRWAHPLSHIEPGCVLIANEKLGGVFHQTVVLIIDHNEGSGSTGIVINRPLNGNLLKIASETESNVDLSLKLAFNSATVTYGGPVLQEEYSVLHGYGNVDGSKKVAPGVFVGGSEELMKEVRRRNLHPNDALFVKGHAAWVPNQLAREISKGVWYTASCSSDFLLRYACEPGSDDENNDLWSDILTCMGDEFAEIANNHGNGDNRQMP